MKLIQQLQFIVEGKFHDYEAWMDAVKKANQTIANKLKFRSRVENGKHLFYAEIPGEDRCYGVYNMDDEEGEVLSEGNVKAAAIDIIERAARLVKLPVDDPDYFKQVANKALELDFEGYLFDSHSVALEMAKNVLG